jgi:hypothetical protein
MVIAQLAVCSTKALFDNGFQTSRIESFAELQGRGQVVGSGTLSVI